MYLGWAHVQWTAHGLGLLGSPYDQKSQLAPMPVHRHAPRVARAKIGNKIKYLGHRPANTRLGSARGLPFSRTACNFLGERPPISIGICSILLSHRSSETSIWRLPSPAGATLI
eukprot:scaffold139462_cov31-Tisochrysis_lutea.AAC.2